MPAPDRGSNEPWAGAVVRFLTRTRQPVGAGLLLAPDTIITCAHVVNSALGRPKLEARPPADVDAIAFDLPQLARGNDPAPPLTATALSEFWSSPVGQGEEPTIERDIALLRIDPAARLPLAARAQPLAGTSLVRNTPIALYGFPAVKFPTGNHALGSAMGLVGGGLVQVRMADEPDNEALEGYSGAPVWAEVEGDWFAVGLATYRTGSWRLLMQPADAFARKFPFEIALAQVRRRTPAAVQAPPDVETLWRMIHLVDRDDQCDRLHAVLGDRGAPKRFFVLHGLSDDLPEKLIRRYEDEYGTQAALGAAGSARGWPASRAIQWPTGQGQSAEQQLVLLRERLANELGEPPFSDDRAIAAALNRSDAPALIFSVAIQSYFTRASARAAASWADLWSRLPSLGLKRTVLFVLLADRDKPLEAAAPPRRGFLQRLGLFGGGGGGEGADEFAPVDIRAACEELLTGRADAGALPPLDACVELHVEDWLQRRVATRQPRFAPEEVRARMMQEIMRRLENQRSFRLRSLESSLRGKG